ncbi:MarR family transcriptional regulator [Arthrobacter sp. TS-15]|uniref:MarR family winged helix-turn-helix transcriptional regulator n=1 Tax=Arthrobacter sp. TS-15 TaxID=2510797 RepID=UPI00115D8BBC|nr:MarR family transcriptional regulator [Arthrobacter sp. TS-15]TQS88284.1 MarR family transcriptional regulator [Arthrobacter sp. TS-15]
MTPTGDYIDTVQDQWRRIDPDISSAPAAIVGRIRRLAHLIQLQSDRVLAECGITRAEFDILALLTRTGRPMTPSELSSDLITSAAGTTKRINKLVDSGLVTRESNPQDGRGAFIRMTSTGRDLILPVLRSVSDYEESVTAFFSRPEREELAKVLRSLLLHLEATDS